MTASFYSNHTQVFWTCLALAQGRTINHMDEIGEVRGWRLGAIVHRLRTDFGWPIFTDYRGPERIGHYRLAEGTDPLLLRYPRSAEGVKAILCGEVEAPRPARTAQQRPRNGQ